MTFPHFYALSLLMSLLTGVVREESPSLKATLMAKQGLRRVLLLYARERTHPHLLAQQRLFDNDRTGLDERDFDQIIVIGAELSAADQHYLRGIDRELTRQTPFVTYLIGKDGGIKQRFMAPVPPQTLFRLVDTMPMRQQEMRRRTNQR